MSVALVAKASTRGGGRRSFWWHFLEMVAVMLLSMAVFGSAVSGIFALLGHGNLLHYAALRGGLMTIYMVLGMGLWMRFRRHGWASVVEMSAAMALPYAILVGPFAAGVIEEGAFLAGMHVLMLPAMYAAMAHRRAEYASPHASHLSGDHREGGQR
jgi:flagellar biosynthetic protein FliP